MCKTCTGVVALLLAVLVGPACSNRSGLKPGGEPQALAARQMGATQAAVLAERSVPAES